MNSRSAHAHANAHAYAKAHARIERERERERERENAPSRHQRCSCGSAHLLNVVLGKYNSVFGKPIDVGRLDFPSHHSAVGRHVRIANIIVT